MLADPILQEIRSRLEHLYGDRLTRVVLFGSRARGDARADSDYDVAIFLRDMNDRWAEFDRIGPELTSLLLQHGAVVEALPFQDARFQERTPLMGEIRREGVEI